MIGKPKSPLKVYLFENDLTIKGFALDLGISASYLYTLVSGDRKPSLELAQKIVEKTKPCKMCKIAIMH